MPNAREIEIIFRAAVPVGGGRQPGKAWPTGFFWEYVRALLRRFDRTQPRVSTLILVHIRGKTVETWKATPDGKKENRLEPVPPRVETLGLQFGHLERGALDDLCPEGGYRAQPRVSTLGTLKINAFALTRHMNVRSMNNTRSSGLEMLKGREADLIKPASIAAPKLRVRN
jgi:hypothetical protein